MRSRHCLASVYDYISALNYVSMSLESGWEATTMVRQGVDLYQHHTRLSTAQLSYLQRQDFALTCRMKTLGLFNRAMPRICKATAKN